MTAIKVRHAKTVMSGNERAARTISHVASAERPRSRYERPGAPQWESMTRRSAALHTCLTLSIKAAAPQTVTMGPGLAAALQKAHLYTETPGSTQPVSQS